MINWNQQNHKPYSQATQTAKSQINQTIHQHTFRAYLEKIKVHPLEISKYFIMVIFAVTHLKTIFMSFFFIFGMILNVCKKSVLTFSKFCKVINIWKYKSFVSIGYKQTHFSLFTKNIRICNNWIWFRKWRVPNCYYFLIFVLISLSTIMHKIPSNNRFCNNIIAQTLIKNVLFIQITYQYVDHNIVNNLTIKPL